MDSLTLKAKYNKLLAIENKAGDWLDNSDIPISEREAKIPEFRKVINELSDILRQLRQQGADFKDNEVLDGFHLESEVY